MARKLRMEYAGAIYHVINRGDRREPIFKDDLDKRIFLQTLTEACLKTSWQIHAYCLMPNHFHLVMETPQPNLVAGMKWFLGTYTSRFNRRHDLAGHLFSGRYKAQIVDGSGDGYLRTACDYVHLNPARAGLLLPGQPLREYSWSSYPAYLRKPLQRPAWLRVDRLLGELRIPKDSEAGRQELSRYLESKRLAEQAPEIREEIRGQWCLASDAFRKELLAQFETRRGPHHYGPELRQSEQEKAEQLIQAELKQRRWTEEDLGNRLKTDAEKTKLAMMLRRKTTMTMAWIAARLQMGSVNTLKNTIRSASQ